MPTSFDDLHFAYKEWLQIVASAFFKTSTPKTADNFRAYLKERADASAGWRAPNDSIANELYEKAKSTFQKEWDKRRQADIKEWEEERQRRYNSDEGRGSGSKPRSYYDYVPPYARPVKPESPLSLVVED